MSEFKDKYQRLAGNQFRDPSKRTATARLVNTFESAPESVRDVGMDWYGTVHDAARKSDFGAMAGAGIVAAVSPNMDWENANIHALDEIQNLTGRHQDLILRSVQEPAGSPLRHEARAIIKEQTPEIAKAGVREMSNAIRIMRGEHPDSVLPRRSSPKTNSFFHNIFEPHLAGAVTIDGRQADIIADVMRPWGSRTKKNDGTLAPPPINGHNEIVSPSRGVSSADLKTGKLSRYEEYEDHVRRAAAFVSRRHGALILPHQFQAVTWEEGKNAERRYDPIRSKGDTRRGQSYQHRLNNSDALRASSSTTRQKSSEQAPF